MWRQALGELQAEEFGLCRDRHSSVEAAKRSLKLELANVTSSMGCQCVRLRLKKKRWMGDVF